MHVRAAVKAVPLICSAYRFRGQRCGLFCPAGSAPGIASVACSFPKPLMTAAHSSSPPFVRVYLARTRTLFPVVDSFKCDRQSDDTRSRRGDTNDPG